MKKSILSRQPGHRLQNYGVDYIFMNRLFNNVINTETNEVINILFNETHGVFTTENSFEIGTQYTFISALTDVSKNSDVMSYLTEIKYKHYKGSVYTVLIPKLKGYRVVINDKHKPSEDVVYCNEEGTVFIRPYDMFHETVRVGDKEVPRFSKM